jgi:hypothetical protein
MLHGPMPLRRASKGGSAHRPIREDAQYSYASMRLPRAQQRAAHVIAVATLDVESVGQALVRVSCVPRRRVVGRIRCTRGSGVAGGEIV